MKKEKPVSQLPRLPRNPMVEAERQGFDDGYFGKASRIEVVTGALDAEYRRGFYDGQSQRKSADKAEKKRKVQK